MRFRLVPVYSGTGHRVQCLSAHDCCQLRSQRELQ